MRPCSEYKKHTRLDNQLLSAFVLQLLQRYEVRAEVLWFANNTIYGVNGKLRFVDYRLLKERRVYQLSKVDYSRPLELILEKAAHGARIAEFVKAIESDEITKDDAESFISDIIDGKLIISELEPLVTGEEPSLKLVRLLKKYPSTRLDATYLKDICDGLAQIDACAPGVNLDLYKQVVQDVHSRNNEYEEKEMLQSDLIKPVETFSLGKNVLEELKKGILFLIKILEYRENPNLRKFKEEFRKRYDEAEVLLLEVLDAESGIGYPVTNPDSDNCPLLQDIVLDNNVAVKSQVSDLDKMLMECYRICVAKGEMEINLTLKDFTPLITIDDNHLDQLPSSFSTVCTILAPSFNEIDKGNFEILYAGTRGPSAVSFLGRFCHADDAISQAVSNLAVKEEEQDSSRIYAEVAHLAQARIGNVLIRPSFRQYEIPILTLSAVDESKTIPLSDLWVSIRNNKIVLRSQRLNKEIIPRNSTAHNFSSDSLPYYHFLCVLQFQDRRNTIHWQWGILNELSFLPRVRFGKIIFSKARWIVDLAKLDLPKNFKEEEFATRFQTYAIANRIPEKVVLTQADNQLPLHLGHPMCLKILMQELKRNKRITLEECLFTDDNLFVTGPEGKFTNEFIIPWTMVKKNANTPHPHVRINDVPFVRRSFTPGSSWHYVKIYCGVKTADKLLTEVIKPLVEELLSAGVIHKWFFIRYADPDHHLRIRFSGGAQFYSVVTDKLNELLQPYLESNLVWKIQTDTYQRELERYGPENIENSESLFFYDSVASIQILSLLEGDEGDDLRWQFAFKGVNDLLNSFGLDLPAKKELLSALSTGFLKEFDAEGSESKKQLGAKYRGIKDKIQIALQPFLPPDHEFVEVWEILSARSKNLETPISAINSLEEQGKLSVSKSNLMGSYIHMFLNRFLRSKQRLQEMVIYDLLHRHYRSLIARETASALVL